MFKNIGVNVGLVGCIDNLKVDTERSREYSLIYPSSPDIREGFGIGQFVFVIQF